MYTPGCILRGSVIKLPPHTVIELIVDRTGRLISCFAGMTISDVTYTRRHLGRLVLAEQMAYKTSHVSVSD